MKHPTQADRAAHKGHPSLINNAQTYHSDVAARTRSDSRTQTFQARIMRRMITVRKVESGYVHAGVDESYEDGCVCAGWVGRLDGERGAEIKYTQAPRQVVCNANM